MPEEQQTTKQHPIPQQILGIQFKLVGDLTLKQFGYLAGFGLFAYITFVSPLISLFRIPLAATLFFLGIGLALVPVQDQPMDQWLAAFFRAIFSPTRWVWQKKAELPEFLTIPTLRAVRTVAEEEISPEEAERQLRKYLASLKEEVALGPADLAEKQRLETINLEIQEIAPVFVPTPVPPPAEVMPAPPAVPAATPPPPPAPAPLPARKTEVIGEQPTLASSINYIAEPVFKLQRGASVSYVTALRNVRVGRKFRPVSEVVFAPARERVVATEEAPLPTPPKIEPLPSVAEVPRVKPPETAEKAPTPPAEEAPTPAPIPEPTPKPKPTPLPKPAPPPAPLGVEGLEKLPAPPKPAATASPPPVPRKVEFSLPERKPNAISGAVYDRKGNPVGGVLAIVKDPTGLICRATKADQLGQFVFSPLPNGDYTVEIPRAKEPFAIMKVELTGGRVPALEIKQK